MDNRGYEPNDNTEHQRPFSTKQSYQQRSFNNDYLVEVHTRNKILRKPKLLRNLAISFLILAVLFFILMVVFLCLYSKPKQKICASKECLKAASNYLSSMNVDVDPCDNFYNYVCGNWVQEHPNHGWWSSFSSFTTITEKIAISSRNVLSESTNRTEPTAIKKIKNFYKSCIDTETIDDLGVSTIFPFLTKMNIPIIPNYMVLEKKDMFTFNWLQVDTLVKKNLLMDVFIGATVGPNIYNGSQNVLYIGQIYQTSPLPSPIKKKRMGIIKRSKKETLNEFIRSANSNIIKYLIRGFIYNTTGDTPESDLLDEAANIILDISDFIDEVVTNTTDPNQTEDDTDTITIANLQKEIDSVLTEPSDNLIINYLNYLFNATNVTINQDTDLLYVTDLDVLYLKIIIKYLMEIPDINIELYMWWAAVYAMIYNTSSDISEYIKKQLTQFSSDSERLVRGRSLECALLINNYMGYAVSYALAEKSFLNNTKPKVENMISEIKQAFMNNVNEISWMDAKTKKATLEKSKEMITFIGYPNWLFEEGKIDEHYNDIKINPETYLENMMNVILSHSLENLNSLRKTHKRDWYSEPIEVNAFNSFSDNAINIPMAILSFPMYNLGLEVLNYGSIGSILGHELIHGFDNTGRKFDKYGNYAQWWTNKTSNAFEKLTECFINQYENITIPGVDGHINGKITLGENLADNGGLNQAIKAYKNYMSKHGEEPKLVGLENFSSLQLFFIAYTSIWCETTNVSDLEEQLQYDEHCPNFIRVLGALQNSEDFAKTFKCPKGSPMNPVNKCKIW